MNQFFFTKKVIKFFVDKKKVEERYNRSKFLKDIVPKVIKKVIIFMFTIS